VKKLLISIGASLVLAGAIAAPALAWHPKIQIVKKVQDLTSNSALVDANDATSALAVKPGDTIKYVIEVSNIAPAAQNGDNDLAFTVMTDSLPTGVELASNPSLRKITENLGTIKPGKSVVKEYTLKVTASTDGTVVTNEACANGDSIVKDNPQHGCDKAVVKVSVPPVVDQPKQVLAAETIIPRTGPESVLASTIGIGSLGYGISTYLRSKKAVRGAYKQ